MGNGYTQYYRLVQRKRKSRTNLGSLAQELGHKHISGGLKKAFQNLLAQGTITYMIPDKPRSRLQKYRLFEF